MIKITKLERPVQLSDEVVNELTLEFIETKKTVWQKSYIKKALLKSSHYKCCYCECQLDVESKYMEVEHFYDKDKYPERVVEWDNLLPSCKRCNGNKSDHDALKDPIVNPSKMDPRQHFKSRSYRYYGKSPEGKLTIELLGLNDTTKVVNQRYNIGEALAELINDLYTKLMDYANNEPKSVVKRNRLISITRNILQEALPTAIYSAITATELVHSTMFGEIIVQLKTIDLWNIELNDLYTQVCDNAYELDIRTTASLA